MSKDKPRGWLKRFCDKNGLDFNNTKQALYRYRNKIKPKKLNKLKPKKYEANAKTKAWIKMSLEYEYAIYTIKTNKNEIYVGYSGDLEARFNQHTRETPLKGKEPQIMACEFATTKDLAISVERSTQRWYRENSDKLINGTLLPIWNESVEPKAGRIWGEEEVISHLTMNDIYEWLESNPNNVITIRMTQNRKNSIRSTWTDQYSKFADFLSIVNLIK